MVFILKLNLDQHPGMSNLYKATLQTPKETGHDRDRRRRKPTYEFLVKRFIAYVNVTSEKGGHECYLTI